MVIEILGTPFNGLGTASDIENPGDGLRQAQLISALETDGHSVVDLGDLLGHQSREVRDPETGILDLDQWIALSSELSTELQAILDRRSFPLLLGGDCRLLIGIFAAFAHRRADVGLVFLDGHADFHSPKTSASGDPADMELAVLTGRGPDEIVRMAGKYPLLADDEVVVYGIRDWDSIAESDVQVFDMQRLEQLGLRRSAKQGLVCLAQRNVPVWLHLDVDVLDPKLMPVIYPEPGGLTFEDARELLGHITGLIRVLGMSVACYHPRLDGDGSAAARVVDLVSSVISNCGLSDSYA